MDLPLLAITALGFLGVYLMMPRERVALVRLGGLVSVLALGGLFLYLIRMGGNATSGVGSGTPSIYFYVFAGIMIMGSVAVITQPRPVYAALHFVLVTLAGAGLFVLLYAQFMAIVLVIVYAGAILVTYVFVLMLASQSSGAGVEESGAKVRPAEYDRKASTPLVAVLLGFVLLGTVLQVLHPREGRTLAQFNPAHQDNMLLLSQGLPPYEENGLVAATLPATAENTPNNIQVLGLSLYRDYAISMEITGLLLTIALVGAVVISRKNQDETSAAGTGRLPVE